MEEDEVWVPIAEFEHYLVSNLGRIFSTKRDKILRGVKDALGHPRIALSDGVRTTTRYISHIVCEAFYADYRPRMRIKHIDGDILNVELNNLQLLGPYRNEVSKRALVIRGGTPVRVVETGEVFRNAYAAARSLRTDASSIYKCLRGDRLSHLGYSFKYEEDYG